MLVGILRAQKCIWAGEAAAASATAVAAAATAAVWSPRGPFVGD